MRSAGILMPVTALPSPWGVGTLGAEARSFIDFLADAGQSIWQLLPIGPTSFGDSPYQSPSTFAGNPYLIDLDDLCAEGLLERDEYAGIDWGDDPSQVDYGALYRERYGVLRCAVRRLLATRRDDFDAFCARECAWLDDYALFMAIKDASGGAALSAWDEPLRMREPEALERAACELAGEVAFWKAVQCLFFEQWERLRAYAHDHGIRLMGDMPIYVAEDSADLWAHPDQFQLDEELRPTEVAGCPPDGFSATGQLWGNPLFAWDRMEADGFPWWIGRIRFQLGLYDILRIDHFRGFDTYWAIPAGESTARNGRWENGPGMDLFRTLHNALGELPIVAEDLGEMFDSVRQLLADSGFPGMKVLQFAFTGEDSVDLPHNYPRNCVAYPGTHDNNTLAGWFGEELTPEYRQQGREYFALNKAEGELRGMLRGVMASTAALAIIPMADWLEEPSVSRMNTPGVAQGNWQWRVDEKKLTPALAREIKAMTVRYFRAPATRK